MKTIFAILLGVMAASASGSPSMNEELSIPVELDSSTFDRDVDSVATRLRRLLWESKREKFVHAMNSPQADPAASQAALDALVEQYPELKEKEPHAFEFHQGRIHFFQKNFDAAYAEFNLAIEALEKEFPGGKPPAGKYHNINSCFMSDLYMGRGVTAMMQGRDKEAIRDMDKAINISPEPRAYMQVSRCRALLRLGKYSQAAQAYDIAYSIDPDMAADTSDRDKICGILNKKGFKSKPCGPAAN